MAPKFFTQGNQAINLDHVIAIEVMDKQVRLYVTHEAVAALRYTGFNVVISGDRCPYVAFSFLSNEDAALRVREVLDS
jgi:hypothetical protein